MIKNMLLPLCLVFILVGCKTENNTSLSEDKGRVSAEFDSLLSNYYEDGLRLNPIAATTSGDMRYNDRFPNFLSPAFEDSLRNYYSTYKEKAQAFDNAHLSESEQMSKEILMWECNMNLETLEFDKEKCVVCELCIPACPLHLFEIDFR